MFFLSKSINDRFYVFIVSLLGCATALALIIAGVRGTKWMAAMMLGLAAFYSIFVVTRNFRTLFLFFTVAVLPIRINFHLILEKTPFTQLKGLSVSLFDLLFAMVFLFWILQLISGRKKFSFIPSISIPALLYIFFSGLSIINSDNRYLSFLMLILIFKSYLVFIYFANNVESKNDLFWIVVALAAGVFLQSCFGILQYLTGGSLGMGIFGESERAVRNVGVNFEVLSRVGGTMGSPNQLAMYLNFVIPVIFCFLFTQVNNKLKLVVSCILLLGILTELLTLSRGAWIALAFGILICTYVIINQKIKSKLKAILLTNVIVVLLIVGTLGIFSDVRNRLFGMDYGSAYSRIPMMAVAVNIIKHNMVLGVGLNNYAVKMNRYDSTSNSISYKFPYPVHNAFLLIAAESGIITMICFLLVIIAAAKKSIPFFLRESQSMMLIGVGVFSGISTWIIHAMFRLDYAGLNIFLWFYIGLLASIYRIYIQKVKESSSPSLITYRKRVLSDKVGF